MFRKFFVLLALASVQVACQAAPAEPSSVPVTQTAAAQRVDQAAATPAPAAKPQPKTAEVPVWRHPAPGRLVAIGDVHGDYEALITVLKKAGVLNDDLKWSGAETWLVQTGDLLDRGPKEREVVDLMLRLRQEAPRSGGRVIQLNGNHELMNVAGDLRYVTPEGFTGFADIPADRVPDRVPPAMRGRVAAFMPGGPYAVNLSDDGIIAQVGDSVFVHGGVTPEHVQQDIGALNQLTRQWMQGHETRVPEKIVVTPESPVWTRRFSLNTSPEDCRALAMALDALGAKRLVVGHTVQKEGITRECDDRVWRIDVGMSAYYGGKPQALEITASGVRIIE